MASARPTHAAEPADEGDPSAPRLTTGSLSSIAALGAAVLSAAITTPFILQALGSHTYGIWVLLTVVAGYTQLADFGVASAVSRFLGEHRALGQAASIRAFLGGAALLYVVISLAVIAVSATLGLALPVLIGIPLGQRTGFLAAAVLVGVATALALWMAFFLNVLHAHQRLPLANLIRAAYWLLLASSSIVVTRSGLGLEGLAAAMALTTLLTCTIALLAVFHAIPDFYLGRPERRYLRQTLSYGSSVLVISASATVVFETSNLIIAGTLGIGAVAAYAIALRLTRTLTQFLHKVSDVLFPFYAGMRATGDLARMRQAFLQTARLEVAGAAAVVLALGFGGRELLRLWVGADNVLIGSAFALAATLVLMEAIAYPGCVLATASGGERPAAMASIAQAGLNLVLALALVFHFGITGVIAAAVLAQALTSLWWMPRWSIGFLQIRFTTYLQTTVTPVVTTALPGLFAGLLASRLWHSPLLAAAVALAVYGVVYSAIYTRFAVSPCR